MRLLLLSAPDKGGLCMRLLLLTGFRFLNVFRLQTIFANGGQQSTRFEDRLFQDETRQNFIISAHDGLPGTRIGCANGANQCGDHQPQVPAVHTKNGKNVLFRRVSESTGSEMFILQKAFLRARRIKRIFAIGAAMSSGHQSLCFRRKFETKKEPVVSSEFFEPISDLTQWGENAQ
tara:strand:- start:127154 stop:127681 length:528 start_codon:yes stop_codon:yes gene_type:complete